MDRKTPALSPLSFAVLSPSRHADWWLTEHDTQHLGLKNIAKFHIESFDNMIDSIPKIKDNISPIRVIDGKDQIIEVVLQNIAVDASHTPDVFRHRLLFPAECRIQKETYTASVVLDFSWNVGGQPFCTKQKVFEVPLMVMSKLCHLSQVPRAAFAKFHEDENEPGGYFIINGTERFIRMTVVRRRNYPMSVVDNKFTKMKEDFSEYGVKIRCVLNDESSREVVLHYAKDGSASISFKHLSKIWIISLSLLLKALINETDLCIYKEVMKTDEDNTFLSVSVKNMLRSNHADGVYTQSGAKNFIGKHFDILYNEPQKNSEYVADRLIQECILIHLKTDLEKFILLCFMTRKLYALVEGKCIAEDMNNPMYQEILTSGQLYLLELKRNIELYMQSLRRLLDRKISGEIKRKMLTEEIAIHCTRYAVSLTPAMKNMISTGNISTSLQLWPKTGYTSTVERTNILQFVSQFRSVIKGAVIPDFVVSDIRKLRPEDWGFICPLHTPDGELTGKKNHLSLSCEVVTIQPPLEQMKRFLRHLGMFPYYSILPFDYKEAYQLVLDGNILGWVSKSDSKKFVRNLKFTKSLQIEEVPQYLEVVLIESLESHCSLYNGIFLFSTPGRLMRPVRNLKTKKTEYIGIFEQVYLYIALSSEDDLGKKVIYKEFCDSDIFSVVANAFPLLEFNQSSRSIFACHMGKQAIGLPFYSQRYRGDLKSQHLIYPQRPLVCTEFFEDFKMDEYPYGTSAIVAVMSYTGYDMEDAVVLNKASVERGFKRSYLYRTLLYKLESVAIENNSDDSSFIFGRKSNDKDLEKFLDVDGLPFVGVKVEYGDPVFSYRSTATGETYIETYKYKEVGYIENVKILGNIKTKMSTLNRISITFRCLRIPVVGDKFANRHGQKGICSFLFKPEDMPFTSGGIIPDILFNPNGLVSRMTIGMMVEVMAGKYAAVDAKKQVVRPFEFTEDNTACDLFCEKLKKVGYNYLGTEIFYSGISGEELEAHVFSGIVYYERLRHQIIDKCQVGCVAEEVDVNTQQPVKTKNDAAIRFGEMERDSLISHGASLLLYDRLMHCSDCYTTLLCTRCGSLLLPVIQKANMVRPWTRNVTLQTETCRLCKDRSNLRHVEIPYALIYLLTELASINVRMKFTASEFSYSNKSFLKYRIQ